MKKTIKPLAAAMILALCLAGCAEAPVESQYPETTPGNANGEVTTSSDKSAETTVSDDSGTTKTSKSAEKSEPYDCVLDNGVTVTIGAKAADSIKALTDKLGKEIDFMEAASCVHPGNDKVYTFEGFTVTTSPDAKGDEYVAELSFLSDAVGFENGIMIGSSEEDVTAAFGDKYEEKFGVRKYSVNGVTITFTFTDKAVSALSVSKTL